MNYVYSTVTGPVCIAQYSAPPPGSLPEIMRSVTIKGGANLPNRHGDTPTATETAVTDDELAFLMGQPMFLKHVKDGFFVVRPSEAKLDFIAADMTPKDRCAPKTDADFEKPPVVAKAA